MNSDKDINIILNLAKKLKIDVKEKLKPPQIAWQLENLKSSGHSILGTLGNFSLVTGKAKSGKSFLMNIAVSTAVSKDYIFDRFKSKLPTTKNEVLYFDTEQGKYHVQLALKRICKQVKIDEPPNLHVYHLRSQPPNKRLEIIEALIYENSKVGFVVIDGIKDLVTSINDEGEATMIASKLLKWTEERNIHIVVILHQNKSDNNARGHLGTELINKAETVLSVTKDNNIYHVQAEQCRNLAPEPFAFEIIDDLPVIINSPELKKDIKQAKTKVEILDDSKVQQLIKAVFKDEGGFKYTKLRHKIQSTHNQLFGKHIVDDDAKKLITDCRNKGWLLQERKRTPYTLGDFGDTSSV